MSYHRQFVNRLQRALGVSEEDLNDLGDLAVLCNHAAIRIERLEAQVNALRRDLTARREDYVYSDAGDIARGVWVVRDPDGNVLAWDQYRNDLLARFPHLVIVED